MERKRRWILALVGVALALAGAACGGGGDESATTEAAPPPETSAPA